MNKPFTLLFFAVLSFNLSLAQSSNSRPSREIGLRMYGVGDFDLIYKKQKEANKYNRIRLASANISIASFEVFTGSAGLGLALGKEKHLPINNKISFIKGWEFIGSINSVFSEDAYAVALTPGYGLVLGFQYEISNRFNINLEAIPSVSTSVIFTPGDVTLSNFNVGFNSDNIALSLMYRF